MSIISIGTKVKATIHALNSNASPTEFFGKIIEFGCPLGYPNDFVATILWEDGTLLSANADFFAHAIDVLGKGAL